MGDREANEELAHEFKCLMKMEESDVEETELQHVITADSSDGSVTGTEGNAAVSQSLLSVCQEIDTHTVSNRDNVVSMGRQETNLNLTGGEISLQTCPDLQTLLSTPLVVSLDSPDRDIKLLAALVQDKYDIFRENLGSENHNPSYVELKSSSLLEIACQMKNRKRFVELLLKNDADPDINNSVTGMHLLHATAKSGNFEVLETLLKREQVNLDLTDNTGRTILHWWAWVSERNQGDKESLENCFKILLQRGFGQSVRIDCKDISGKTPLCIALECDNRDGVLLLLGNGADVMACEPTRQLLESCSTLVLKDILDYCVESKEPVNSERWKVTLRYDIIKRMLFLADVPHHKDIVRHAAFSIFLSLTWKKIVRDYILGLVFYYVLFLISLTAYILHYESADTPNHESVSNNTNGLLRVNDSHVMLRVNDIHTMLTVNDSHVMFTVNDSYVMFRANDSHVTSALRSILIVVTVMALIIWFNELYVYGWRCIKSMENWLKLVLFIVTLILCLGTVDNIEENRHLFAITILLGWIELLLLLGRLPELSVQTEMLKTVSLTFVKFIAGYVVLILAFVFSFYILFKKDVEGNDVVLFTNPLISILKTIVMFTGEFYSPDLPFDRVKVTSHVIFSLFVFLIAIVLLNLLNGLAVGDTEKIRKEAETVSLVARARITSNILHILSKLPSWAKERFSHKYDLTEAMFVLYPNTSNQIESSDLESLRRIITKKREMSKKLQSVENVENRSLVEKELSELRLQFEKMQEILIEILNK